MRITYIHQHFATMDSFSGVRSLIFSKHLTSRGHEVTIITSDKFLPEKYKDRKRFKIFGIKVINVKTNYTRKLNFSQRVLSFIKFMFVSTYLALKSSPDLVFATSTPLTVAFPGMVVKFIRRVPFVFEVRDLWPDVPIELGIIKNRLLIFLMKLFEKTTYHFADRIVCISEGIRQKIPAPHWKKMHIPVGCDFELFNGMKNSRWREKLCITGRSLFVFTGAIGKANNPECLMEAAKILKERNFNEISIALIGEGSAKENVLKMKDEYELDNVLLLDTLPKRKLPDVLASADGGIILHGLSPTYQETAAPNKFYDYIAAGLPVVFNFRGPLRELILEKNAGYYVNHRSPEQLSEILIHISRNKSEASEFGKNARLLAEEKFDQKKLVVRFEKALVECYRNKASRND